VDGDSFAHRAYHGLPKTILGVGGKPAGAIVGFANFLLRMVDQERVRNAFYASTPADGTPKQKRQFRYAQFKRALDGQIVFDGSSIDGFSRVEESDMLLVPDPSTFRVFPWEDRRGKVARMICDIRLPDGSSFAGCPRNALRCRSHWTRRSWSRRPRHGVSRGSRTK
jgi:hypothetical protein